ncbi:MAG: HlyD family efflux transporter periplasmic adaptor subunit [Planctomycetota bacterium]
MMTQTRRWIPSRRWLFLPPLLLGVGVLAALAGRQKELPRTAVTETVRPLYVNQVSWTKSFSEVTGFGTARAKRVWTATAEVSGRVERTHVNLRSGRFVQAGENLVEIDSTDYQLRVNQRLAELAQAEAQLNQIERSVQSDEASLRIQLALLKVRQEDLNRLEQLRQQTAASASELDLARASRLQQEQSVQNLRNNLNNYPAQIASAEAAVELAEARVAEAERDLSRTKITAPFDGVLSGVALEAEQVLSPNEPLFQLLDISTIEIEAQFSVTQLDRVIGLRDGISNDEGTITSALELPAGTSMADAAPSIVQKRSRLVDRLAAAVAIGSGDLGIDYVAKPIRILESLDEQTRTLGVVVEVDNTQRLLRHEAISLRPGAYCRVDLRSRQAVDAIELPRTSVDSGSGFVVDDGGILRRQRVDVAFSKRDLVAVVGGLKEGDFVVVRPPASSRSGDRVEPRLLNSSNLVSP